MGIEPIQALRCMTLFLTIFSACNCACCQCSVRVCVCVLYCVLRFHAYSEQSLSCSSLQKGLKKLCEVWAVCANSHSLEGYLEALQFTCQSAKFPEHTQAGQYKLALQRNSYDCGVYCLTFLDTLIFGDERFIFEKTTSELNAGSHQVSH